jgi:hypothetical protein
MHWPCQHRATLQLLHAFAVGNAHAGTTYLRLNASYSHNLAFQGYLALLLLHASQGCAQQHGVDAVPDCILHAHTMHTP